MLHEEIRHPVQHRSPRGIQASHLFNQAALLQGTQHAGAIYTAHGFDLGPGDRLAIGDDRQGFQGWPAQAWWSHPGSETLLSGQRPQAQ